MYNLQQLKSQLEQQLNSVNAMIDKPAIQPAPVTNIESMIQAAVQRQIAAIAPPITIMSALGAGMSVDDQKWVSANLNQLPAFLQTTEGKDLIGMTVDAFKTYCGATPPE